MFKDLANDIEHENNHLNNNCADLCHQNEDLTNNIDENNHLNNNDCANVSPQNGDPLPTETSLDVPLSSTTEEFMRPFNSTGSFIAVALEEGK